MMKPMKEKTYLLNGLLSVVVGLALLANMVIKSFLPGVSLPKLNLPMLTALSLIALVIEYYLAPDVKRAWVGCILLACATFGLLPWAVGLARGGWVVSLALAGGAVFGIATWLFDQATQRIASGPAAKAAPVLSALVLFLASQSFAGILL